MTTTTDKPTFKFDGDLGEEAGKEVSTNAEFLNSIETFINQWASDIFKSYKNINNNSSEDETT